MPENWNYPPESGEPGKGKRIRVHDHLYRNMDLLKFLRENLGKILIFTVLCSLIAFVIISSIPPKYKAHTSILPVKMNPQAEDFFQEMGVQKARNNEKASIDDVVLGILQSRTIKDKIIKRFDLMTEFETDKQDKARKALTDMIQVNSEATTGIITISALNNDPEKASKLANGYVSALEELLQELAITQASRERLFLEKQLGETQEKLIKAENELKECQKEMGILDVEKQAATIVQSMSSLKAALCEKEVELSAAMTYATRKNYLVRSLEAEVQEIKDQLRKIEVEAADNEPYANTLQFLPDAGMEYLRKVRTLEFYETLYNTVLSQYQNARMAEAKETLMVQILDRAVPPDSREGPGTIIVVFFAGITAAFFSFSFLFLKKMFIGLSEEKYRAS